MDLTSWVPNSPTGWVSNGQTLWVPNSPTHRDGVIHIPRREVQRPYALPCWYIHSYVGPGSQARGTRFLNNPSDPCHQWRHMSSRDYRPCRMSSPVDQRDRKWSRDAGSQGKAKITHQQLRGCRSLDSMEIRIMCLSQCSSGVEF